MLCTWVVAAAIAFYPAQFNKYSVRQLSAGTANRSEELLLGAMSPFPTYQGFTSFEFVGLFGSPKLFGEAEDVLSSVT